MKNWFIRLQILLILLIFASPIIFLLANKFKPHLDLIKYDLQKSEREVSYPQVSWLTTRDKAIINDKNEKLILRGINIASTTWGPEFEQWNPLAVTYAVDNWSVNVIRTRIHEYEYVDNPANFFFKLETQILDPARSRGVYVILHPWFGENQSLPDENGVKMWLAVAKRYQNDPHILYDIFAEPRDIDRGELINTYNSLIPQIRQVNPRSLIFVTGLDWGREINSFLDSPLPYDNLVYRTNPYNKTGEFEGLFGRIAEIYPVFIGEFGSDDKLTMTEESVQSLLGYADALEIGWTAWHFSDSGCPCLLSDNNLFTPTSYGQIVLDALRGKTGVYPLPQFDLDPNKLYVYSDFFESGFSDYSWLSSIDLQNTSSVYTGSKSIQAKLAPAGGIYFHTSRNISSTDYFSFDLAVNSSITNNLTLRFRAPDDSLSSPILLSEYITGQDDWSTVRIPTSQIDIPQISGFMLESAAPLKQSTVVYLDQIFFSR